MDHISKPGNLSEPNPAASNRVSASSRIIDTGLDPEACDRGQTLGRNRLVNTLNLSHFQGKSVRIHFRHVHNGSLIFFNALPQPCFGKYLVCLWNIPLDIYSRITNYTFQSISFTDSSRLILADARLRAISTLGICVRLPEKARIHSVRKEPRHPGKHISARIIQNSLVFSGTLSDLSASAFCVTLEKEQKFPGIWLNETQSLTLLLESNGLTVYSGQCRILKKFPRNQASCLILAPVTDNIQRFSPRAYRSRRQFLSPSPDILFCHPLTGQPVDLKAADISGAGVSVADEENKNALIPGMLIDEMSLCFANAFRLKCRAQVIYRRAFRTEEGKSNIRCGIAFLDMEPNDHMRLLSLLHQTQNKNIYLCHQVNLDELWAFFFETGFIYPKKYAFIRNCSPSIRQTYEKLYSGCSRIARHFTWQKNGQIIAHVAMLRFYQDTWLIHHLASRTDKRFGTGTEIIDQLGTFAYDTHRLASSHMSYAICYYRPSNRFPAHFFGGVAKKIENPKACSTDRFAYYYVRLAGKNSELPDRWTIDKAEDYDLTELQEAYRKDSDGLMLKALDLAPPVNPENGNDLCNLYHQAGLKRKRRVLALRHQGLTKAVIMANVSDQAVNLSDFTNCLSLFVIDESIAYPLLQQALYRTKDLYANTRVPVLLYPLEYARRAGFAYDRVYELWALDLAHSDDFFRHYKELK